MNNQGGKLLEMKWDIELYIGSDFKTIAEILND